MHTVREHLRQVDHGDRGRLHRLVAGERGEGVISTGIAVLIMALIGAAMWVAFSTVFDDTSGTIEENVTCVANDTCPEGG